MLKSIRQMLDAFHKNQIIYCHWKSNEHLVPALEGDTDLDMLFLPEQRSELERILNMCGLKRFRSTPLMQYTAIEDFIGFDQEKAKIWHLHLHYRMTLGEKHLKSYTVTPWGRIVLKNRVLDANGIYISCSEDELLLLFIRMALKLRWRDSFSKIGKDDIIESEWLYERIDRDKFMSHGKEFIGEQGVKYVLNYIDINVKNKSQLFEFQKYLRRILKPFTAYSAFGSWIIRTKREAYWGIGGIQRRLAANSSRPNRRISPSGGGVIVFLGCDGAGKSTTLEYVKKELSKKIDVKHVYLGSGDGSSSLLRKPMKIVAKKIGGKGVGRAVKSEYSTGKKVSWKARMYSCAKVIWAVTLAYEKKKKLRQITKARNNGMVVLVDRYPQTNIPDVSDGPLLTRYLKKKKGFFYLIAKWELKIYHAAEINAPDLTVKLVVPTEVAISRKPEMTVEEIESKKKAVMDMDLRNVSCIIDTSVEKEVSFSKVMDEIWRIV